MRAIDTFTPMRSLAIAVALSGINPKNLLLTVGAAAAIASTGSSTGQQAVALAVFVLIGTLGPGAPVVIYFALGDRATRILDELKTWMAANNGGDHGRALPRDRRQADRRRHQRACVTAASTVG